MRKFSGVVGCAIYEILRGARRNSHQALSNRQRVTDCLTASLLSAESSSRRPRPASRCAKVASRPRQTPECRSCGGADGRARGMLCPLPPYCAQLVCAKCRRLTLESRRVVHRWCWVTNFSNWRTPSTITGSTTRCSDGGTPGRPLRVGTGHWAVVSVTGAFNRGHLTFVLPLSL